MKMADRLGVGVSVGMQYGTLIHAWMEQIKWLDDGLPDVAQLRQVASRLNAADLDIDARISDFVAMLEQTNVSRLLSRKSMSIRSIYHFPKPCSLS